MCDNKEHLRVTFMKVHASLYFKRQIHLQLIIFLREET